ncbi:hypothetical protein GCM10023224_07940 [Streptomonospora halophila]|uniref:Uncharacterized protein n=1 Tax=Streptomonospora halophila TaxID=427369 RepID=A0ABP9GAC9_9ACTN
MADDGGGRVAAAPATGGARGKVVRDRSRGRRGFRPVARQGAPPSAAGGNHGIRRILRIK